MTGASDEFCFLISVLNLYMTYLIRIETSKK